MGARASPTEEGHMISLAYPALLGFIYALVIFAVVFVPWLVFAEIARKRALDAMYQQFNQLLACNWTDTQ